jgi:phospholipid/cholesterol/gamma-HCH transport system substrate-binding protein
MRGLLRLNLIEAVIGVAVVALAVWFILFAWNRTGGGLEDSFRVKALFPAANGVSVGTDVRVAGLRVGQVTAQRLDPQSYQAEVTLAIDEKVKIPSDSSAAITAEGLLGGTYIALLPGGAPTPLKEGDIIFETQGSVDMLGLIGSVINRTGGQGGSEPSALDNGMAGTAE